MMRTGGGQKKRHAFARNLGGGGRTEKGGVAPLQSSQDRESLRGKGIMHAACQAPGWEQMGPFDL